MGIGIVLLVWLAILLALAKLGATVLRALARRLTRQVIGGREKAILLAGRFPYACLVWAISVFVFQAAINTSVFHHDVGLGDSWGTSLPGGYAILMIDTTDRGIIYNPKTQRFEDSVIEKDDAVGSVTLLQLADRYILGCAEERTFGETISVKPARFFLLDTKAGHHQNFASENALRDAARPLGIRLALQPIAEVYARYRFTWFDTLTVFLLFIPPLSAALIWLVWVLRQPKQAAPA